MRSFLTPGLSGSRCIAARVCICIAAFAMIAAPPPASAAPVALPAAFDILGPADGDLDANGQVEVHGSYLVETFTAGPLGGHSVSFDFMFLTSESGSGRNLNDLFFIRLVNGSGGVLGQVSGAAVDPGQTYTGAFDRYDFVNGTVTPTVGGSTVTPTAITSPQHVDASITIPAAAGGLSFTSVLDDGGIGWRRATFGFGSGGGALALQFVVADAGDGSVDSALLIDHIVLANQFGGVIESPSFEAATGGLAGWAPLPGNRGEVGLYPSLGIPAGAPGLAPILPTHGQQFAVLSTASENAVVLVPEPATLAMVGLAAVALLSRRRRR